VITLGLSNRAAPTAVVRAAALSESGLLLGCALGLLAAGLRCRDSRRCRLDGGGHGQLLGSAVLSLRHLADAVVARLAGLVLGECLERVSGVVALAELLTGRQLGLDHRQGWLRSGDLLWLWPGHDLDSSGLLSGCGSFG